MNNRMKKSKGIMALLIATVVILTAVIPLHAFAAPAKLSDVAGIWAEKEINAWVGQEFINGYPDGTFKPNNNITRAEFVALVNRVFKFTETAPVTFKDVKDTDWFSKDVAKAEKAGYLNELKTTGSFKLRESITRQEVAAIIYKLKALAKDEREAEKFTDAAQIGDYFKGFIGAVKKAGYMQGYPDGKFDPEKNLTRAEAVVSLNNVIGIMIPAVPEQTAYIDAPLYVNVKTDPVDATISAKSSDETVLKVEISGKYVIVKGIKEGSATVTVTAKKANLTDKEISFAVNVKKNTGAAGGGGGGGSSSGGSTTPSNSTPVITVVEPDGVNDKIITLTQGTAFTAPAVTANDAEDGNITSSIVKAGEDKVDTFKVGEYILTYNVKDSKGLAAAEVKVTVKVVAAELSAEGTIAIETIGKTKVARVTLTKASIGKSFKSVDTEETAEIGKYLQLVATNKTKADFELLDSAGMVVGKFTVDLTAGGFIAPVTAVEAPAKSATGNVLISTIGTTKVARVTLVTCSVGKSFKSVNTKEVADIGKYLQIVANNLTTAEFEVLDAANAVIGKFTVNIADGNFTAPVTEVEAPVIKVDGTVAIATIASTDVARVTVTNATAGTSFKSVDTGEIAAVGNHLQLVLEEATKASFELLDASGDVIGSFEVTLAQGTFSAEVN